MWTISDWKSNNVRLLIITISIAYGPWTLHETKTNVNDSGQTVLSNVSTNSRTIMHKFHNILDVNELLVSFIKSIDLGISYNCSDPTVCWSFALPVHSDAQWNVLTYRVTSTRWNDCWIHYTWNKSGTVLWRQHKLVSMRHSLVTHVSYYWRNKAE